MKQTQFPTISNYGNYSSGNYGSHCLMVRIPATRKNKHGITIYYSYDTVIAFRGFIEGLGNALIVHKNDWSSTTGKHLNWIDGGEKKRRYDSKAFANLYAKAIKNA